MRGVPLDKALASGTDAQIPKAVIAIAAKITLFIFLPLSAMSVLLLLSQTGYLLKCERRLRKNAKNHLIRRNLPELGWLRVQTSLSRPLSLVLPRPKPVNRP